MFAAESGSRTYIRHSGLKGNPVKIRSCPRNCNPIPKHFGIVIYPLQMPLLLPIAIGIGVRRPVNSGKPGDLPFSSVFKAFG